MGQSAQVIALASRKPRDWTAQEIAELYRVGDALRQVGWPIVVDRGYTDEGDPWVVYCDDNSGAVIAHVAKSDGLYVLASSVIDTPIAGPSFKQIIGRFLAQYPMVVQPGESRGLTMFVHPVAALGAIVATLAAARLIDAAELSEYGDPGEPSGLTRAASALAAFTHAGSRVLSRDKAEGHGWSLDGALVATAAAGLMYSLLDTLQAEPQADLIHRWLGVITSAGHATVHSVSDHSDAPDTAFALADGPMIDTRLQLHETAGETRTADHTAALHLVISAGDHAPHEVAGALPPLSPVVHFADAQHGDLALAPVSMQTASRPEPATRFDRVVDVADDVAHSSPRPAEAVAPTLHQPATQATVTALQKVLDAVTGAHSDALVYATAPAPAAHLIGSAQSGALSGTPKAAGADALSEAATASDAGAVPGGDGTVPGPTTGATGPSQQVAGAQGQISHGPAHNDIDYVVEFLQLAGPVMVIGSANDVYVIDRDVIGLADPSGLRAVEVDLASGQTVHLIGFASTFDILH